ncbi:MAG: ATP-binding protein [Oscillospiraceae bacterium]|nr:ATP-binding protein [Oscillospiraceae bacterium]
MTIDGRLLQRAKERLDRDRLRRERDFDRRLTDMYAKYPALMGLDREINGTMADVIRIALEKGEDPAAAVMAVRDRNLELRRQRERLLVDEGYPADYLDEKYACPHCRDTGYRGTELCECLMSAYKDELKRELESCPEMKKYSFEDFSLDWYSDEADPETGLSPRECMESVYRTCVDYARFFGDDSFNLFFCGNTGLGKTMLSTCIARVVAESGHSVVYESSGSMMALMEDEKFSREPDEEEAGLKVERCFDCDLLILDDLGTEMLTSFVQSALYNLINTRLIRGKKTIISSNLTISEMRRRYSPQTVSRILGEYRLVPFVGGDIRLKKTELE